MINNLNDSDSDSVTSSVSTRGSRNRSTSRNGRNSSGGSRASNTNDWAQLCEFDDVDAANYFVKTNLPKNATRTSTKPYCIFFDRLKSR